MDAGLWKKLQGLAAAGERVVVVEDGETCVLLSLSEYERIKSGEVSLQRLPGFEAPLAAAPCPLEASGSGDSGAKPPESEREELWQASKREREKEISFTVDDAELGLASDEAEEEERFYLEPVE